MIEGTQVELLVVIRDPTADLARKPFPSPSGSMDCEQSASALFQSTNGMGLCGLEMNDLTTVCSVFKFRFQADLACSYELRPRTIDPRHLEASAGAAVFQNSSAFSKSFDAILDCSRFL